MLNDNLSFNQSSDLMKVSLAHIIQPVSMLQPSFFCVYPIVIAQAIKVYCAPRCQCINPKAADETSRNATDTATIQFYLLTFEMFQANCAQRLFNATKVCIFARKYVIIDECRQFNCDTTNKMNVNYLFFSFFVT